MEFAFTKEQERFRQEVRSFFLSEPWDHVDTRAGIAYSPTFYRKVAQNGWLGLLFPKKYGGLELDNVFESIFQEEMGFTGAPVGDSLYALTVLQNASIIAHCGSEQLKSRFLPPIIRGDLMMAHALTEPEAGSDLAAIQTTAVRQGDVYIVNGQKMFATYADMKDIYTLLMARTAPKGSREKGISLFILANNTPGISHTPIITMADYYTNQVFYDNVKIQAENRIGEENEGWNYFMQNKVYYWYRTRAFRLGRLKREFRSILDYLKKGGRSGADRSFHDGLRRQKIGQMAIDMKVMHLLTYLVAWKLSQGLDAVNDAAKLKVFSDEAIPRFDHLAMQVLGISGLMQKGSTCAPMEGQIEWAYRDDAERHFGDGGGPCATRNHVAIRELGLPCFE